MLRAVFTAHTNVAAFADDAHATLDDPHRAELGPKSFNSAETQWLSRVADTSDRRANVFVLVALLVANSQEYGRASSGASWCGWLSWILRAIDLSSIGPLDPDVVAAVFATPRFRCFLRMWSLYRFDVLLQFRSLAHGNRCQFFGDRCGACDDESCHEHLEVQPQLEQWLRNWELLSQLCTMSGVDFPTDDESLETLFIDLEAAQSPPNNWYELCENVFARRITHFLLRHLWATSQVSAEVGLAPDLPWAFYFSRAWVETQMRATAVRTAPRPVYLNKALFEKFKVLSDDDESDDSSDEDETEEPPATKQHRAEADDETAEPVSEEMQALLEEEVMQVLAFPMSVLLPGLETPDEVCRQAEQLSALGVSVSAFLGVLQPGRRRRRA